MTELQNSPLFTPLMSLNVIHDYIEMVKVYAIDAEHMNDQLVKHCLELSIEELKTLVKELEMGYKVSHDQTTRYFKIVYRCEVLMYSAGTRTEKAKKARSRTTKNMKKQKLTHDDPGGKSAAG
jgi:hypothetical protein